MLAKGFLLAGRYRIVSLLGWGGQALIYAALDERRGDEVALKLLRQDRLDRANPLRLINEARAERLLDPPNVVELRAVHAHPLFGVFLVLERLSGHTLAKHLESGPLPESVAVRTLLRLAEAHEQAEARGVLHLDIKPANIYISDGRVVL